ncbi:hypothetical protein Bca4012_066520 [Brassica carinata]
MLFGKKKYQRFEGIFGGKIDKPIIFGEILIFSNFMSKASKILYQNTNFLGSLCIPDFLLNLGTIMPMSRIIWADGIAATIHSSQSPPCKRFC